MWVPGGGLGVGWARLDRSRITALAADPRDPPLPTDYYSTTRVILIYAQFHWHLVGTHMHMQINAKKKKKLTGKDNA